MRIVSGDKMVAFVFDNTKDIEDMLAELSRMRTKISEGEVQLPVSFLGMDERATDEDRDEFLKTMAEGNDG